MSFCRPSCPENSGFSGTGDRLKADLRLTITVLLCSLLSIGLNTFASAEGPRLGGPEQAGRANVAVDQSAAADAQLFQDPLAVEAQPEVTAPESVPAIGISPAAPDVEGDPSADLRRRLEALEQKWQDSQKRPADTPSPTKVEKKSTAPTFKLGGQLIVDGLWFAQDAQSMAAVGDVDDAFDFRRARLYGTGEAYEIFSYAMGFDFAQGSASNGRPAFIDNWMQVKDLPWVNHLRVGHFFEPFSLERSTSNRNTTFIERSLADAFAPSRNTGLMVFDQTEDQSFFWAVGTFRGNSDNFGDDAGDREGQTVDTRLVYRPFYDEESDGRSMLHLGYAYSFRRASDGVVQFRSRPEAFGHGDAEAIVTPYFTNTGVLNADSSQLHGLEMVWIHGPLSIQGEYMAATVNRTQASDVAFHGGYVYASFFLTGEHRPYNRELAIMDRLVPRQNFIRKWGADGCLIQGTGAWEIAVRLSQIDLSNGDVNGGRLTDLTAGLNWYLTPHNRMKFDYVLAHRDQAGNGTSNTSIFGIRFDTDF